MSTESNGPNFDIEDDTVRINWRRVGMDKGLTTDTQIARFLIQQYEQVQGAASYCVHCHTRLTLLCLACRMPGLRTQNMPATSTGSSFPSPSSSFEVGKASSEYTDDLVTKDSLRLSCSSDFTADGEDLVTNVTKSSPSAVKSEPQDGCSESQAASNEDDFEDPRVEGFRLKDPVDSSDDESNCAEAHRSSVALGSRVRDVGTQGKGRFSRIAKQVTGHMLDHVCALPTSKCTKKNTAVTSSQIRSLRSAVTVNAAVRGLVLASQTKDQPQSLSGKRAYNKGCKTNKRGPLSVCNVCDAEFPDQMAMRQHRLAEHPGDRPFQCSWCSSSFKKRRHLRDHTKSHTGERPFVCSVCGQGFALNNVLKMHMRTHTKEKPYICQTCGFACTQSGNLQVHIRRAHTGERPFVCEICHKSFVKSYDLKRHKIRHSVQRSLSCKNSSAQKSRTQDLANGKSHKNPQVKMFMLDGRVDKICDSSENAHGMDHVGQLSVPKCVGHEQLNDDRSLVKPTLEKNSVTATDVTEFFSSVGFMTDKSAKRAYSKHVKNSAVAVCNVCDAEFPNRAAMKEHRQAEHPGDRPFQCALCTSAFKKKRHLRDHMVTHTGEKAFLCTVCGQGFSLGNALKMHMRTHTKEKPYACETCGFSCTQPGNLKEHIMRAHTGERPFVCEMCCKSFVTLYALKRHKLSHTDVRPFQCEFCSAVFKSPDGVKSHVMNVHSASKMFTCSECSYTCSVADRLRQHMRSHSNERPLKCHICSKSFRYHSNLARHRRLHPSS